MANSAPTTVIRKTAMAMMKLLIRRSYSRRRTAAPTLATNGALRRRTALHQTALTRAFPAQLALTSLPLASHAIITQLRASLDQEFAASAPIGPLWAGGVGGLPAHAWCDRCS